jgi:hypothetical protein
MVVDTNNNTVSVWERSGNVWLPKQDIELPNGSESISMALDGDTAVIGSIIWNPPSPKTFVYQRNGSAWTLLQTLPPTSPDQYYFGFSVAVSGSNLAIGSPIDNPTSGYGAVYVYSRKNGTWQLLNKLVPNDYDGGYFGVSLGMQGDTLVVGSLDPNGQVQVDEFRYTGSDWKYETSIHPPDLSTTEVRTLLSLDQDRLLVGYEAFNAGQVPVHLFKKTGDLWTLEATLEPSLPYEQDCFGWSVALDSNLALVGSPGYGNNTGTAYLFQSKGGIWSNVGRIEPLDPNSGLSVALSGPTALVAGQQYAWFYWLARDLGDPCHDAQECESGYCVDGVCCSSNCGGGATDDCQACSVAAGAIVDGECAALSGTPCAAGVCDHGVCVNTGGTGGSAGAGGMGGSAGAGGTAGSGATGGTGATAGAGGTSGTGGAGGDGGMSGSGGPSGGAGGNAGVAADGGAGSSHQPHQPAPKSEVEPSSFYTCSSNSGAPSDGILPTTLGALLLAWLRRRSASHDSALPVRQ